MARDNLEIFEACEGGALRLDWFDAGMPANRLRPKPSIDALIQRGLELNLCTALKKYPPTRKLVKRPTKPKGKRLRKMERLARRTARYYCTKAIAKALVENPRTASVN